MSSLPEDVTVVVRSVGERTAEACRHLLEQQVPAEHVVRVEDLPFGEHIDGTYEVALEHQRKWTLVVDADVLPNRSMVEDLRELAESSDPNLFAAEGWVHDKFYGGPSMGGGTIYRTELLHEAIELVPKSDKIPRPESATIHRMRDEGYSARWESSVEVGVHDFEQSYQKIFRKANAFAKKNEHSLPVLEPFWRRAKKEDDDFEVFYQGVQWAKQINSDMTFNATQYDGADVKTILKEHGIDPKPSLSETAVSFDDVEAWMSTPRPPEYNRNVRLGKIRTHPLWDQVPRAVRFLTILLLQKPFPHVIPWTVGTLLSRSGEQLQRWAKV